MGVELRPLTAVALLAVVLIVGSGGSIALSEGVGEEYDPSDETIEFQTDDRELWLYTSRAPSFNQATLALNVVVYEGIDDVEQRLLEDGVGEWREVEEDERDVGHEDGAAITGNATVQWDRTVGDQRHVFLTGENEKWKTQSFEVHDGEYLGSRYHIRVFGPPNGEAEWTAMQAHDEYWDLFDARHVVTSVEGGQSYLEKEYIEDDSYVVVRDYVGGEDRVDFDGWLTIVEPEENVQASLLMLGLVLLSVSAVRAGREEVVDAFEESTLNQQARMLGLAVGLITVYMFVRLAAVWLERTVDVAPNTIAALLYPVLFVGLPVTAFLLAQKLERSWAFTGASLGFLTALMIDYTYLGVSAVPLDILIHRGALIIALGLIAVGGSRTERENPGEASTVQIGVLLWVVATLLPLLKHTPLPV